MDREDRMKKMMHLLISMTTDTSIVMHLSALLMMHVSSLQKLMDASEQEDESLVAWNWSMVSVVTVGLDGPAAIKCGVNQYFMLRELLQCSAITAYATRSEAAHKVLEEAPLPGSLVQKVRNDSQGSKVIANYLDEEWDKIQRGADPNEVMEEAFQHVIKLIPVLENSGACEPEGPDDWEPTFPWSEEDEE